mmetsp:Transcript_34222/g.78958  ORF Transcript_34222/g.78958 Transcript_34222/m.78958 type:complete len:314 (+) Transcript_34222:85-1026(+)
MMRTVSTVLQRLAPRLKLRHSLEERLKPQRLVRRAAAEAVGHALTNQQSTLALRRILFEQFVVGPIRPETTERGNHVAGKGVLRVTENLICQRSGRLCVAGIEALEDAGDVGLQAAQQQPGSKVDQPLWRRRVVRQLSVTTIAFTHSLQHSATAALQERLVVLHGQQRPSGVEQHQATANRRPQERSSRLSHVASNGVPHDHSWLAHNREHEVLHALFPNVLRDGQWRLLCMSKAQHVQGEDTDRTLILRQGCGERHKLCARSREAMHSKNRRRRFGCRGRGCYVAAEIATPAKESDGGVGELLLVCEVSQRQ